MEGRKVPALEPGSLSRRWQLTVFAFGFLVSCASAWHNLMMPFLAPGMDHWCARPADSDYALPVLIWKNSSIPTEEVDEHLVYSQCLMFNNSMDNYERSVINCAAWEYNTSVFGNNIVNKWDLVCDREWLISLSQSVFMGGYITSMVLFGHLSDRIGRRPTMFCSLVIFIVSGFLCLASGNYLTFTIFRFFVSMGVTGAGTTAFILLMEIVSVKDRSHYGIGFQFGWATGYVILPGLAWLIKDWFYLQLATIIPSAFLVFFWWYIPESPRWLLANGYEQQAKEMYMENEGIGDDEELNAFIEKINIWMDREREFRNRQNTSTFIDLFRRPNMRKKTLNLFVSWFVNSFIYFALSLNTSNLGGNPYLNFFLAGIIEFPACIGATFLIRYLGRRIPQMTMMLLGGAACLLTIPLMEGPLWLRISLAMLGKFCITGSFATLYVFSAELYPTVVRTVGVGASSICARAASMMAPFVKELGEATHPNVPFAVFGTMAIVSGLAVLLLPETKNRALPDSVEDGERL